MGFVVAPEVHIAEISIPGVGKGGEQRMPAVDRTEQLVVRHWPDLCCKIINAKEVSKSSGSFGFVHQEQDAPAIFDVVAEHCGIL